MSKKLDERTDHDVNRALAILDLRPNRRAKRTFSNDGDVLELERLSFFKVVDLDICLRDEPTRSNEIPKAYPKHPSSSAYRRR
jgi:hypothetical protein